MTNLGPTLGRLWRGAVFVVRYEMGIWRSLVMWLFRLRTGPPGARPHRYAGPVTPVLIVFIAVSAIELPIVHMLLPWETVRLIVDIISVWGLFWMIGLLASVRVHPHLVTDEGIWVRYGTSVDVMVPWDAVASVRSHGRAVERGKTVHYEQTPAGRVVSVLVMKQTTVDLVLRDPTVFEDLPRHGDEPVVELRLYADDPGPLVSEIRERLGTSGTAGRGGAGSGLDRAR
jgi:hypothetical protein